VSASNVLSNARSMMRREAEYKETKKDEKERDRKRNVRERERERERERKLDVRRRSI
jgi:hypothetical protein